MPANLENSAVATGPEKVIFVLIPRRVMPKKFQTTIQLSWFHMLERLCSKSLNWRSSSIWTKSFQMYKPGFKESEEPEIKLSTLVETWRNQGHSRKTSTSASLSTLKPLTVWITTNCGKFLKRWVYQTTLPASWETCMWVKKQQLELEMEQLTGSKSRTEYSKAVYCHPTDLISMQRTSHEMQGWMNHKLESR